MSNRHLLWLLLLKIKGIKMIWKLVQKRGRRYVSFISKVFCDEMFTLLRRQLKQNFSSISVRDALRIRVKWNSATSFLFPSSKLQWKLLLYKVWISQFNRKLICLVLIVYFSPMDTLITHSYTNAVVSLKQWNSIVKRSDNLQLSTIFTVIAYKSRCWIVLVEPTQHSLPTRRWLTVIHYTGPHHAYRYHRWVTNKKSLYYIIRRDSNPIGFVVRMHRKIQV